MEDRGKAIPLTERERAARHFSVDPSQVTPEMIEQLPPPGTGLETGRARGTNEEIDMFAMFLLAHSMVHMETEASPGIVVYPEIARTSPCKCAVVDGAELCFSHGIIGAMDEAQKKEYCQPKTFFESPGLTERLKQFKAAVTAAQEKIKNIPKGERLQPWLFAMSEELGKRGIKV